MVKSSVDWIQELNTRDKKHLEGVRRLHCLFQFNDDYILPRHYKFAEDFLFAIDRIMFGDDDSFRRRIFGLNPWIIKPGYFIYDCFYKGWVAKHPLKKEWLDARERHDRIRLLEDRKRYYAEMRRA